MGGAEHPAALQGVPSLRDGTMLSHLRLMLQPVHCSVTETGMVWVGVLASAPELSASTLVEVMTAMAGMPMPMTVRDCPLLVEV